MRKWLGGSFLSCQAYEKKVRWTIFKWGMGRIACFVWNNKRKRDENYDVKENCSYQ